MKLSSYAKKLGIHYNTAYRMFKRGQIAGYQLPTCTVIIEEPVAQSVISELQPQFVAVYLPLYQQYVTLFCTDETEPSHYAPPVFASELSERLHRVAIQQAAGIAKSWRTNRQAAYEAYMEDLTDYAQAKATATASGKPLEARRKDQHGGNGIGECYQL